MDGDVVPGESAAIVEYTIAVYGDARLTVRPGEPGYVDCLSWFHFSTGSFMPSAMFDSIASAVGQDGNAPLTALRSRLDRACDQVEARLGEVPYLAGDAFTAADTLTLFPLTTMRVIAPPPNVRGIT